jgi:hypothetical protein
MWSTLPQALTYAAQLATAHRMAFNVFEIIGPRPGFLVMTDLSGVLPPWPHQWKITVDREGVSHHAVATVQPGDAA